MCEEADLRPEVDAGDRLAPWHIVKTLVHQGIYKFAMRSDCISEYIKSYFPDPRVSILTEDPQIASFSHHVFRQPMDTFQESQLPNTPRSSGNPSRKVWQ